MSTRNIFFPLDASLALLLAAALAAAEREITASQPGQFLENHVNLFSERKSVMSTQVTALIGLPTLDLIAISPDSRTTGDKTDCRVRLSLGGSIIHAGTAYRLACDREPLVAAILARDPIGRLLTAQMAGRLPRSMVIPTASATRTSLIVPDSSGYHIYTNRPRVDSPVTIDAIERLFDFPDLHRILIGSLSADDDDLLEYLLRKARDRGVGSYWLPTGSQIRCRKSAFAALALADFVQLNSAELATLSGCRGIVPGINRLRAVGAIGTIICTDGSRGIVAFHDGDWYVQKAFDTGSRFPAVARLDVSLGDTTAGYLCAWIEEHDGRRFGEGLRYAAAGAAMRLANVSCQGGWRRIHGWAADRPLVSSRRTTGAPLRSLVRTVITSTTIGIGLVALFLTVLRYVV